ncbi:MAG: hypothetical protein JXA33_23320 [Anaerolineae bacterium]|nr:hypothetical protein [Anaerolineae bacterium]
MKIPHDGITICCCLFVLLLTVGSVLQIQTANVMAQTSTGAVGVYYIGPEDAIANAIDNAAPYIVRVDQDDLAQVFVINNAPISDGLRVYGQYVQNRTAGMVIFCGRYFPQNITELSILFGVSTFGMARSDAARSLQVTGESDSLQSEIAWTSAPQIRARTVISNPNLLQPLLETVSPGSAMGAEPFLQRARGREKYHIFMVGGWLSDETNTQWQDWPYFQYFVYRLIVEAAGIQSPLPFAQYPLAPVPQGTVRMIIAVGGIGIIVFALGVLFLARRYLYLNPERVEPLRILYKHPPPDDWQAVGFHRPLAGFFTLLSVGSVAFLPLLVHRAYIIPYVWIPWAQTLDAWRGVGYGLTVVWMIFDLEVGIATARYFARFRFRNPVTAFRYFQFYIWWQFIGGAIQLGGMAWVVIVFFPRTALAHLAYYFLLHALIQFPGFLRVFGLFFRALQRCDYEQLLTAIALVGPIVFQAGAVLLLRRWGAAQPGIGIVVGSVFGLGIGLYLTEWCVFGIGVLLYRTLGYSLRALLLPTFDRQIARYTLIFGAQLTLGSLFIPASVFVQAAIFNGIRILPESITFLNITLVDWELAYMFILVYTVLSMGLYDSLMPAMVEAYTRGYQFLFRYYVGRGLHYGLWFSMFLLATLGVVGEPLVLGVWPALSAAAQEGKSLHTTISVSATSLIFPLLVIGAFQWPAWSMDRILEAVGRPLLKSGLTILELSIRVGLLLALIPTWQTVGLLAAYLLALLIKITAGWIVTRRLVVSPRFSLWRTAIAPAGAALLLFNLLQTARDLWWQPTLASSLGLFIGAFVLGVPCYGFLTAFLGSWDNGGLVELKRAVALSGIGYPLAWILYQSIRLGAFISPLHGRRPSTLRIMAEEEAHALSLSQTPFE